MEMLQISSFLWNNQNHNNFLQNSTRLNIEILSYKSEHECKGSPGHFRDPPVFPTAVITQKTYFHLHLSKNITKKF